MRQYNNPNENSVEQQLLDSVPAKRPEPLLSMSAFAGIRTDQMKDGSKPRVSLEEALTNIKR